MPFYQFQSKQIIPASIESVWDFISAPSNLKKITPEYMGFEVLSENLPERMYPGMIIAYKVSPLMGIKMTWVTEITQVKDREFFIDEQRLGPYALWHHQHRITQVGNEVEMTDIVSYKPPMGFLGAIANSLVIKNKLKEIFEFRTIAIEQQFGKM